MNQDTQPEWELQFDKRFDETYFAELATEAYYGDLATQSLKAFIRQEIAAAERRIAEKLIAEIPEATLTESYIDATLDLKEHLTTKFLTLREDK